MDYKQLFHIDLWKSLGAVFWADEWQMTGKAGVETEIHIYYENYGYVAYDWGRLCDRMGKCVCEKLLRVQTRCYLEKWRYALGEHRTFWATDVMMCD